MPKQGYNVSVLQFVATGCNVRQVGAQMWPQPRLEHIAAAASMCVAHKTGCKTGVHCVNDGCAPSWRNNVAAATFGAHRSRGFYVRGAQNRLQNSSTLCQ